MFLIENDIDNISNDQELLSTINNYVPVYNSFSNIQTDFDTLGKIEISITHSYTDKQIQELEAITKEVINNNITSTMGKEEKIKSYT